MSTFLRVRAGLAKLSRSGSDQITKVVLEGLSWSNLTAIRRSFEARIKCSEKNLSRPEEWSSLASLALSKGTQDGESLKWRMVTLCAMLEKWYAGCIMELTEHYANSLPDFMLGLQLGKSILVIFIEPVEMWIIP